MALSMACLGDGESLVRVFSWRCSIDLGSYSFLPFLRSFFLGGKLFSSVYFFFLIAVFSVQSKVAFHQIIIPYIFIYRFLKSQMACLYNLCLFLMKKINIASGSS